MSGKIHWDKNGKRFKIYINHNGTRHVIWNDPVDHKPFREKWQAETVAAAIKYEVKTLGKEFNINQWKPQRPLAFKTYALGWIADRESKMERNGWRNYKSVIHKHAIPFFQATDIRKLKAKKIRLFYESLEGSYDAIRFRVGVVKAMLKDAHRDEDIDRVPPFPRLPSGGGKVVEYLTLEQQDRILSAIPERHRPIFEFGMEYGLRPQEVRAIQKDCIVDGKVQIRRKFSEGRLRESTKTGELGMRTPELTTYAKGILERVTPHLSPFVFVTEKGLPYKGQDLADIWHPAEKKSGVKIKMYNAMRHSLGCQLIDSGSTLETVRQIYGHTSVKMTERYIRRQITQIANDALEARRGQVIPMERKAE